MKKKILLFIMMLFIMPLSVKADQIYDIQMNVYIDMYGNAKVREIWDVKADSGSEWYKDVFNLGKSVLSDFVVYMDGKELIEKTWDISESLYEKAGYYGINYTSSGLELCFGKGDFYRHTFILEYSLSNYVFNTSDGQVLYQTLFPKLTADSFSVEIDSYYKFPDTLEVWGYGYNGNAYVQDGKVKLSNEGYLKNDNVVVLVKFPLNTFDNLISYDDYDTFDDVYKRAKRGTLWYKVLDILALVLNWIFEYLPFVLFMLFIPIIAKKSLENGYGYKGNKVISKKDISMFREIPCDKDIYYANVLIKLNDFGYKESNIFGAIILKWVRADKIVFRNEKVGIFNKETSVIDLTRDVAFDNELEVELFNMMRAASKDGLLETRELEKWCKNNYDKFFGLFTKLTNNKINELKNSGHIYQRTYKEECKYKNVMDDTIYDDSVKLYGLKKFLEEFSSINTKEVMEVKLWDEYLMFAYLFGIADKVAKQLKDMYPEVVMEMQRQNFDYDTIIFVDHISTRSVSAASSARSAAQSYSSGGGGFSSRGGGGGSFGGGGSMGGR